MSAFVVADKTINRVIATLNRISNDRTYRNGSYVVKPLRELGYEEFNTKLGKDMFALNCRSVDARYGEGQSAEFRKLNYKYRVCENGSLIQAFKSLNCFLYQSCEGECDKEPLYLALERVSNLLAYHIVTLTKEYDEGEWG